MAAGTFKKFQKVRLIAPTIEGTITRHFQPDLIRGCCEDSGHE